MGRPKRDSKTVQFNMDNVVIETLDQDSKLFGLNKGAYLSQLVMQKHMELVATSLIQKMSPEQIQIALDEKKGSV